MIAWRRRACIADGGLERSVVVVVVEPETSIGGVSILGSDEIRQFQCTPRKLVARSTAQSRRCAKGSGKPCQTSLYSGWV